MKKLFLFVGLLAIVACNAPKGYVIQGTISGDSTAFKTGKVYLSNFDKENPIKDTTDAVDGKFTFKGEVLSPEQYGLTFEGVDGRIALFLENAKYKVEVKDGDFSKAVIVGGATQTLYNQQNTKRDELYKVSNLEEALAEYRLPETTTERRAEIVKLYNEMDSVMTKFQDSLIAANPLSHYALQNLKSKVNDLSIEEAETMLAPFKADVKFAENKVIASIEKTINLEKSLQVGMPAIDFTMKDPKGNDITLSEIYKKNKVTMIDFWAGWCGPCRRFNPTLVKIYAAYHKKGFEILGVSLDKEADSWHNAIKTDKLTWPQVSDLNYWDTQVAKSYNVRYIPQNIFVDQSGNIIARKLAEDQITSFLDEHLK